MAEYNPDNLKFMKYLNSKTGIILSFITSSIMLLCFIPLLKVVVLKGQDAAFYAGVFAVILAGHNFLYAIYRTVKLVHEKRIEKASLIR